jgi:co-chaperonin GroES (HSP10)
MIHDFSKCSAPKVASVSPVGSQILIEMLSSQEILGTTLTIKENSVVGAPQGYIRAVGPNVDLKSWTFKVGDRVLLQGSYVPVPKLSEDQKRLMGLVEPHGIKAILAEEQ